MINLNGFTNLYLTSNAASGNGGGAWLMYSFLWSGGRVEIGGNDAAGSGGGVHADSGSFVMLQPSPAGRPNIYNNTAVDNGGGLCVLEAQASLKDVRIGLDFSGNPSANRCLGSAAGDGGGGLALLQSRAWLTNCWVAYNRAEYYGGGIEVSGSRLTMKGNPALLSPGDFHPPNRIFGNVVSNGSLGIGGGLHAVDSTVRIEDALVYSNLALYGGGLHADAPSTVLVVNAAILLNQASVTGGGVRAYGSITHMDLLHCAVVNNSRGGISVASSAEVSLTNCIVGLNQSEQITAGHSVSYSDVAGGYAGAGNIQLDPFFILSDVYDVRLGYGSPCINNGAVAAAVAADAIGEPRPFGAGYDMGAYEYNGDTYDTDGERMTDGWEADHSLDPWVGDALDNDDSDEYLNIEEYISDTDPFDGDSHLQITSITNGATRDVGFLSSTARVYALYTTPHMTNDATWTIVGTNLNLRGNGVTYTAIDTNAPAGQAFYRVDVQVP
ncbi:MAG TPA: choice-of-anchor Q domain-containing protein [Kiritimatiellia bacterium]|nr:choice-of-anchor Q domain-containing protein [Kiritimatiellia bacterium]HRZ10827.1 choice-of-anchor Q domain-containing protein [Kiritimatiellia bacterium]HSA18900.1 choice-of-anchor Q domain-containing protein [Kiritimatiellia bacterium]